MYARVDFNKIRSDMPEGQRGAFEELVCQLARRQAPDPMSYRRIEGAGGDGGVECIHRASDRGIVGYQAKYHTSAGDIDWQAIDRSVNTALTVHPDLVTYVIAIACDFTGTRRIKREIVSDGTWGEWDRRVKEWRAEAANKGQSVEFIPWTADELSSFLTPTEAGGLLSYWFGETEFSNKWFKTHVDLAVAALDERYNPDDHVDVRIQSLFEFIVRHRQSREKLADRFKAIRQFSFPEHPLRTAKRTPSEELIKGSIDALQELMASESELELPTWEPWPVDNWLRLTRAATSKLGQLRNWSWNSERDLQGPEHETARRELDVVIYGLNTICGDLDTLTSVLSGRYLDAEKKRAAIITGRAGTGKSHLLARVAELAVSEKRPVILILGQQLREQVLWPQILARLGLRHVTEDDFLGALDAAAESNGVRGLILIDAINEGAGLRLWQHEIGAFLAQIATYPNLACVLSCRSEYVDYLVPETVLTTLPRFEVRGFETAEEQANAAHMYLDKRGISRPATPWLAPGFVNPLFLRSCCNALQREKKIEFPRGLTGTKEIFAFYLDSAAKHLGAGREGTTDLVGPTKTTLLQIATEMAENRKDHLHRNRAEKIAETRFKLFHPPTGSTWLEVLQRNGLLRIDPDPSTRTTDPLQEPVEVVRFSFQRFQDHLMAEALLAGVDDVKAALAPDGSLSFIHDGKQIHWEWRGLIEALSAQLPDRFKVELVDVLPDSFGAWWRTWEIQDAFMESVRWRTVSAFSRRTLDIFNRLNSESDRMSLLLELSASIDHPWNAEFMHRNLVRRKMVDRDAFWSVVVNKTSNADSHPSHGLIDWSLSVRKVQATRETQWLCALVLTWCFTLSNRQIRDRATKALTALLLNEQDIFPQLVDAFQNVDDLYVLERLYAAAYGACCIDPSSERMAAYAQTTYINLFSQKAPLHNLLLRDYARGIIELANHIGSLPKEVDIARCRPPYVSALPRFTTSDSTLKRLADKVGDTSILSSCDGWGEFGRYEIEPNAGKFVAVKLSNPTPYTSREQFDRFENEIVGNHSLRIKALARLQESISKGTLVDIQFFGQRNKRPKQPTKAALRQYALQIRTAEQEFLALLTSGEKKRYRTQARPWLRIERNKKSVEPKQVDTAAAKRWVAKKAYDFGWNKHLLQHDSGARYEYKTERSLIERIGKKYQWLALSELLCRLSDNFWIGGTLGDGTRRYDNPTDISILRDIDPTVLPRQYSGAKVQHEGDAWIRGPDITIAPTPEDQLTKWPFKAEPGAMFPNLIRRADIKGGQWITLYDHHTADEKYKPRGDMLHGLRQQEFRFVLSVVVSRINTKQFIDYVNSTRNIDVMRWDPPELTDGPYLREAPWRITWSQTQWQSDNWHAPKDIPIAFPVSRYCWESQLDASLPEGARAFLPSPWLITALRLSLYPTDISTWRDSSGRSEFIASKREGGGSSAVIGADIFKAYLDHNALDCIWLFVAERGAWPGGNNDNAAWRRTEGICWIEDGNPKSITWNDDHVNRKKKERNSSSSRIKN